MHRPRKKRGKKKRGGNAPSRVGKECNGGKLLLSIWSDGGEQHGRPASARERCRSVFGMQLHSGGNQELKGAGQSET